MAILSDGAFFGEKALISDERRAATVKADSYVVCYSLGRKTFNELLGPFQSVMRYDTLRKVCCA